MYAMKNVPLSEAIARCAGIGYRNQPQLARQPQCEATEPCSELGTGVHGAVAGKTAEVIAPESRFATKRRCIEPGIPPEGARAACP